MHEAVRYPVIRHLEDEDDLLKKRDGDLIPGQEAAAHEIAEELRAEILDRDTSTVLMITSPKKRAIQTAEMVSEDLQSRTEGVRFIHETNEALMDQDQGEIILPPDYEPGDHFEGLDIARKIFHKETFGDETTGEEGSLTYRFGDPILQEDGTYKYPELLKYFSRSGESYRDVLVRLLGMLIELSENIQRFEIHRTLPVIFTHSQARQIFKDLEAAAALFQDGRLAYKTGQLGKICWEIYKKRKAENKIPEVIEYIAVDALLDEEIIELLRKEREYLRKL